MNPIDFIFLPHGFSDIFDVLFQQAFGSLLGVGKQCLVLGRRFFQLALCFRNSQNLVRRLDLRRVFIHNIGILRKGLGVHRAFQHLCLRNCNSDPHIFYFYFHKGGVNPHLDNAAILYPETLILFSNAQKALLRVLFKIFRHIMVVAVHSGQLADGPHFRHIGFHRGGFLFLAAGGATKERGKRQKQRNHFLHTAPPHSITNW